MKIVSWCYFPSACNYYNKKTHVCVAFKGIPEACKVILYVKYIADL